MSNNDNNITTSQESFNNDFFNGFLKKITNKPIKKFYRAILFSVIVYIASVLNKNNDLSQILQTTSNETCVCLGHSV